MFLILRPFSLRIVKERQNGTERGVCILSYEKTEHERGRESKVSLNPKCLVLATSFEWRYKSAI